MVDTTYALARRWALLLLVLLAAAGIRSSAQQTSGGSMPRGSAGGVTVDFRVITRDGGPVPDLKPDEVTIKVDGKPRELKSLRFIQVPAVPTGRGAGAASGPLPPPYGSNVEGDASRTIIIVLDDDSFRPGRERPVREAVDRFLPELSPRDRVALVNVPYGGVKVDLTTDHDKVRQVLSKMIGQAPQGETGSEAALRTRRTLESLTGLLQGLAGGEGPTTVLFFTSALLGPRRDAPITMAPGMAEITTEHFEQVGAAASAARAQFYIIQPEDLIPQGGSPAVENIAGAGFKGSDNPLEGIEHLAGVTGGERLSLTAGEGALSRVTRETTAYYLATFEPDAGDRNGAAHRLSVGVTRAGLEVRARPGLTIPRATARSKRPTPITPRDMIRQPDMFRDLPLRAAGFTSQEAGDTKLKIIAITEPIDPTVTLTSAAAGLFDAKGKLTAQWTANESEMKGFTGGFVMAALMAPPGPYRLRVAAVDSTGRTGTADYEVMAELVPAGPLKLSAIVLGLSRGGFLPRLEFSAEPVALAYLEIYGPPQPAPIAVTVELARALNAPALLTVPCAVTETSASDRRTATAALPIGGLPPGDYIVRAVVGVEGQPSARVLRTLRKVKPS